MHSDCRFRFLWVLLAPLVPACAAFGQSAGTGTAVVALRSPGLLMAAVDSEETTVVYRNGAAAGHRNMCKVTRAGPFFAIVAGLAHGWDGRSDGDDASPFDALREAENAWRPGDTLDSLVARIGESFPRRLIPLLEAYYRADPAEYARHYRGQSVLQFLLLGTERGAPQARIVEFLELGTSDAPMLVVRDGGCPQDCAAPHNAWFLGTHDRIDAFVRSHNSAIRENDERNLDRLIALEYEDRPDIVGGPVSIVKVDRAGGTLVRGGACSLPPSKLQP
jgi:hypothetical protein